MFVLFVTVISLQNKLYAQQAPPIEWQKCLGGLGDDIPQCIIQTSDGGYAIAGYTQSTDGDVSGIYRDDQYDYSAIPDGWVVKLDALGTIMWQKCIGGTSYDYLHSIIQTSDGGFVVAGETTSTDGDCTSYHGIGSDALIVKLDSTGNVEWSKCYGGNGSTIVTCIIRATDEGKGYIFAGSTDALNGDVSGNHDTSVTTSRIGDAWIVRISESGNILWQKCFGGTGYDGAESIVAASDGGYVFAGTTTSTDGDVVGKHLGGADAWIVKLKSSGNIEWQKCFGGSAADWAFSITKTNDNGYVFLGQSESSDGDVHPTQGAGGNWLVKLNFMGVIQWQRTTHPYYPVNYGNGVVSQATNSDLIVTQTIAQKYDTSFHGVQDPNDLFIGRYNWAGNTIWEKKVGGHMHDVGISGVSTFDGGIIIAAYTNSVDGDVLGYHYNYKHYYFNDEWIIKLGTNLGVDYWHSDPASENFLKIYPNPSESIVKFQILPTQRLTSVQFYNIMGMPIYPEFKTENNIASVDVHGLSNGTYIARVSYFGGSVSGTFSLPLIVQH